MLSIDDIRSRFSISGVAASVAAVVGVSIARAARAAQVPARDREEFANAILWVIANVLEQLEEEDAARKEKAH